VQVAAVPLKLRGELDHEGVVDLLSCGTPTRAGAADRPVRLHRLVDLGSADRPPAGQWRDGR
jgi:hypothetical protein